MTLHDVNRLMKHWRKFPPLRDLMAAYVGFEPQPDTPPQKPMTAEEFRALMAMTGGKMAGIS